MTRRTLVTMADAAVELSLDVQTLRRYVASGRLTAYRVGPRAIRLDAAEVADLARPIPTSAAS